MLQKESVFYVDGIVGIGKSEIAKQYGKKFRNDYTHIIYLHYNQNLKQTIMDLLFKGDEIDFEVSSQDKLKLNSENSVDKIFEKHYKLFKLLPASALVILDNFDSLPEEDELYSK